MRKDLDGRSPYGELVGTTVVHIDPDARSIDVNYEARPEFTNRLGTVSGGMLSAMLDSVTGLAALAVLPEGEMVAHTTLKVEYLRPARPGLLSGHAQVVEVNDRDVTSQAELMTSDGIVVARAEATLRVLGKKRP